MGSGCELVGAFPTHGQAKKIYRLNFRVDGGKGVVLEPYLGGPAMLSLTRPNPANEALRLTITMLPYLEITVIAAVASWVTLIWVRIVKEWRGNK